jgi:hypothetical protein
MNGNRLTVPLSLALAVLAAAFPLSAAPALGQEGKASLARQVADGQPWNLTMPDGRLTRLTLLPNGMGRMEGGPMTMSPTWRETGEGLCLKPAALAPERCAALRREGRRIVGLKDGAVQFTLER